ncbi:hypothetical protein BDZ94DRAFT_1253773 [Collybia nuda]|uniref:Uncharacterized protein n=1 Tax=Collybia nuda TaxID=64659 RepID=A0A9P6CM73_9AGAR|nr:hypothetical protein BDZ94DRAFT_1253773 [Collybia nuda]
MEHRIKASSSSDSPPGFSIELAILVAIWVEVLLYGIYTCLFFESLYIMLKKRKAQTYSGKIFLIAILLMYMVATTHIALSLYRLIQAYVWLQDSVGPASYFFDNKRWDHLAHGIIICTMTWLGDALVIYRCFIIWNQRYIVILLPSLLLIYTIAVNSTIMYWFKNPLAISFVELIPWMNTIYPINFIQNTFTTGLIVFKILHQHRISTAAGARISGSHLKLTHILRIVVESAMVYTIELLIAIILYFRQHNAQFILQYAMVPTIGIVFNLIAVRIHMTESETVDTTRTNILTGMSWWADDHLSTTIELDGMPSRRTDDEAPPMQLKQNGAFVQAESLNSYSGHRRSI